MLLAAEVPRRLLERDPFQCSVALRKRRLRETRSDCVA